jgi:uncharacterized membrane protein YbhN (UPF0104 family)
MKRPFVRSVLSVLFGLAVGIAGFLLVASQVKSPPQIVEVWPIAVGVAVTVAVWFIQGTIIGLLARPKLGSTKVLSTTRLYLASQAAAAVTPFMGGEIAYQLAEFKRLGLEGDDAGAVIVIRSVMNGAVMMVGALVGLIFVPYVPFIRNWFGLGSLGSKLLTAGVIALVVLAGMIAFLIVIHRRRKSGSEEEISEKEGGWEEGRGRVGKIFAKIAGKIFDYVSHVLDSLEWIWRREPRVVIGCIGLMIVYWGLYSLLGTMALRAAGWNGNGWLVVYFAQYVLFIVIPLSPTPGGSGGAEIAFSALMSAYVPSSALLGGVIIWRILNHYSELLVGAFLAGPRLPEDIEIAKEEIGEARQGFRAEPG